MKIRHLAPALAMVLFACFSSDIEKEPNPLTDIPPVITSQPRDTSVAPGETVMFTVSATGALSYQWVRGESDTLAGEVLPVLIVTDVTAEMDGTTYKCVIWNIKGKTETASITLHVAGIDTTVSPGPDDTAIRRTALIDTGETLYQGYCTGCHGLDGRGTPGATPPHANSDWFMNNRKKAIQILLEGSSDSLFVNGMWYDGEMPAFGNFLTNLEIAGLLTYIRAVLNDSTVTSCAPYDPANPSTQDANGFALCTKVARTLTERNKDSVSVAEVKAVRDSLFP